MAAALAIAVSLALVLALMTLLLADHFCSAFRRRSLRREAAAGNTCNASNAPWPGTTAALGEAMHIAPTPPLSKTLAFPFFGHGVLQAPTSYLLTIPDLEAAAAMPPAFCRPAVVAAPSSTGSFRRVSSVSTHSSSMDHLVYISNPIYDGGGEDENGGGSTPFETPETSPSHFGYEEEENVGRSDEDSPALTAMRRLPPARAKGWLAMYGRRPSVATSASATTETNMASFSSSGSPSSSPSW